MSTQSNPVAWFEIPASSGVLIYFSTPDIEAALLRGEEKGGKSLQPKISIGKYGFIGLLLDSEATASVCIP